MALRFVLRSPAVFNCHPRDAKRPQAEKNAAVSDQPPLSDALYEAMKKHFWYRVFWLD